MTIFEIISCDQLAHSCGWGSVSFRAANWIAHVKDRPAIPYADACSWGVENRRSEILYEGRVVVALFPHHLDASNVRFRHQPSSKLTFLFNEDKIRVITTSL